MFPCDTCNKNYKFKRNLSSHIQERHQEKEHFYCAVGTCNRQFIRRGYLIEHLKRIHKFEKDLARRIAHGIKKGERVFPDLDADVNEPETIRSPSRPVYEDISDDDITQDDITQETIRSPYRPVYEDISDDDITQDAKNNELQPGVITSDSDISENRVGEKMEHDGDPDAMDMDLEESDIDDVVFVSYEEGIRDIELSALRFQTDICALTFTKRTGWLDGMPVVETIDLERENYQWTD